MKKRWAVYFALFLMGCNAYQDGDIPEMRYGQDLCSECRMTLVDPKYASVLVTKDGEILKFDDIGCMALFEKKNQIQSAWAWVHDGITESWIERSKAYYVWDEKLATPMGFHLMALASEEALKKYLDENDAKQVRFDQIDELLLTNNNQS